jgi:adenylate cyclase class 2
MDRELELKFRITEPQEVRERLGRLGAKRIGAGLECNAIFDDAGRTLLTRGCGLRVRSVRSLDAPGDPPRGTLTYKGPIEGGTVKSRPEIETPVSDPDATMRLLEALGFLRVITFEKRRESWQLDACHVEIDELPQLGSFVEIEGPDEAQIRTVQSRLGLASDAIEPDTYVALVARHCEAHGITPPDLRFSESP